jgi:hypothetical protein
MYTITDSQNVLHTDLTAEFRIVIMFVIATYNTTAHVSIFKYMAFKPQHYALSLQSHISTYAHNITKGYTQVCTFVHVSATNRHPQGLKYKGIHTTGTVISYVQYLKC